VAKKDMMDNLVNELGVMGFM